MNNFIKRISGYGLLCLLLYALLVVNLGRLFEYYDYNLFRGVRIHYYWAKWASGDSSEEGKWIDALKREGQPAITVLRKHLSHKDPVWRAAAAQVLGKMKARDAVPDLVAAAKDSEESVQLSAIDALAEIKDKSALPGLIALLNKHIDRYSRADVLYALGEIGDRRAIPALIEALGVNVNRYARSENSYLQKCALRSLAVLTAQSFGNPWFEGNEAVARRWVEWWETEKEKKKQQALAEQVGHKRPNRR